MRPSVIPPGTYVKLGVGQTALMCVSHYDRNAQLLYGRHCLGFDMCTDYRWYVVATPAQVAFAKQSKFYPTNEETPC